MTKPPGFFLPLKALDLGAEQLLKRILKKMGKSLTKILHPGFERFSPDSCHDLSLHQFSLKSSKNVKMKKKKKKRQLGDSVAFPAHLLAQLRVSPLGGEDHGVVSRRCQDPNREVWILVKPRLGAWTHGTSSSKMQVLHL